MDKTPRKGQRLASPWWAIGVLAVGVAGSVAIRQALAARDRGEVDRIVRVELRHASESFEDQMKGRMLALERMALRWGLRGEMPRSEWEADAGLFLKQVTGFQAIIWIDPTFHVRWLMPFTGNEAAQDFDFSSEPRRRAALNSALLDRRTAVSHVVKLLPGRLGFHAVAPIYREDLLLGFIGGVFRLDTTIDAILHPLVRSRLELEVWDRGRRVYGPAEARAELPDRNEGEERWREIPVRIGQVTWTLRGRPLPVMLDALRSPLSWVAFVTGLTMSALAAIATYLAQVARLRTRELVEVSSVQEAVLQGTDYGIISVDREGRIWTFNAGAERIFGYRAQEVVGTLARRTFLDPSNFPPEAGSADNPQEFREVLMARIADGQPFEREWTFTRKDGSTFPGRVSLSALRSPEGQVHGIVAVLGDLTASRKEEAVRSMLASFVASSDDAFIGTDLELRINSWNRGAERLFGYTEQEALGQPSTLLSPGSSESVDLGERLLKGESNVRYQTSRKKKNGLLVDVAALASTVRDAHGAVVGITVYMQDITQAKAAERVLIHGKEAAEAATRSKSDFLARMSHEIRTPLNGVLGMIDLALRGTLPPAERDHLQTAHFSARQLLRLINDVLDFSKIEAGQLRLENALFSLRNSLVEVLRNSSARAHGKGLELLLEVDPEAPDALLGDVHRLRQVLLNLLDNAVKFTERGEVSISVRAEEQDGERVRLRFAIRDTGKGIAHEKRSQVFEAFAQEDEATTRKFGGTGLGLSICSQLVDLMGGKLELESELGAGSCFFFSLPFQLLAKLEVASPPEFPQLRDLPAAIVSDSPRQKEALTRWLQAGGLRVVEPNEGETESPQLLVLDLPASPPTGGSTLDAPMVRQLLSDGAPALLLCPSAGGDPRRYVGGGRWTERFKPCTAQQLLEALAELRGAPPQAQADPAARHAVPLRILLAEDNDVNRRVVTGLLRPHGHQLIEVENGRAAVEAVAAQRFDLLLMDVQMPEMDGLEATRRIRAWEAEQEGGLRHIPIVALTAQALEGDAQACRDAGMDGYLAKPIDPAALFSVLMGLTPSQEGSRAESSDEVFDEAQLLARVEGDQALRTEVVDLFLARLPELEGAVTLAAAANGTQAVRAAAHRIQGALVSISARAAAGAAVAIERMARTDEMTGLPDKVVLLQGELRRLKEALQRARSRWS